MLFCLVCFVFCYPLFLVDVYLSMIALVWLMGISIIMIIFCAFCSCSKYSMLGCISIISQLISFELIWTTLILVLVWSWNELSITSYWCFVFSLYVFCFVFYWFIINNYLFLVIFFICILGESNRVPYDLPEAESELVAGLITEYSSLLFSLIILTEYANIILVCFIIIILFSLNYDCLMFFLYFICLIRTTLNSFKFDELLTNAWIIFLPVIFTLCLVLFIVYILISFWILFTSLLWTLYFGLELQWMVLIILIIIGSSVWSGLLNYVVLNGMISIWLIVGILFYNLLLFLFGLLAKVGYFPFFMLVSYQYYLCGYDWIIFDLINKISYFSAFVVCINNSSIIVANLGEWFVLVNFMIVLFFIKFVLSINHLILISSLQLFLFVLCGIYFEDELFLFCLFCFYLVVVLYVLWDCLAIFVVFFLTDLTNINQWMFIGLLFVLFYWMTVFSFFPTIMFLLKFIWLFLFISYCFGWVFSVVFIVLFVFQGFYISLLCLMLVSILLFFFCFI